METFEDERDEEVAAIAVQFQASNHVAHSRVPGTWTDAVAAGPEIKEELLKSRDQNVVVLSWFGGSGPTYNQAVANIRLIGVMGAHFLAFLARETGVRIQEMHVVGQSLGAHVASYVGSALKDLRQGNLGRITGLDPAGPQFEHTDPLVRLDPEDALFVDVIHTDATPLAAGGFGMLQPMGHVDFYPNFGSRVPGCELSLPDTLQKENSSFVYGLTRYLFCNHLKGINYFIESINSPCPFVAYQCSNWFEFERGGCTSCGQRGEKCGQMGYHAREAWKPDSFKGKSQQLYLFTSDLRPHCRTIHSRYHDESLYPYVNGLTRMMLNRGDYSDRGLRVKHGQGFSFLVPSPEIGEIEEILVEWEHEEKTRKAKKKRSLSQTRIVIDRVVVQTLERRAKVAFCGRGRVLVSGERMTMRRNGSGGCLEKALPMENQSLKGSLFNIRLRENIEEFLRRGESAIPFF
ncbi:unnamed protein product [Darwinula stevensoni]|uniref:Lipase domain-containing protein n=1 Tax=Darwinula stevensoni TaxID=69355 RepID=A0A7R8XD62_9CRUS|nr:unnamed protein product [Darwinula stevensoni]CAG0892718.1 unnamed protein product [Darwinula stevensoni]